MGLCLALERTELERLSTGIMDASDWMDKSEQRVDDKRTFHTGRYVNKIPGRKE